MIWEEYLKARDPRDHYTFNPERQPDSDIWDAAERCIHMHRRFGYELPRWVYAMRRLHEIDGRPADLARELGEYIQDAIRSCLADKYDLDGFEADIEHGAAGGVEAAARAAVEVVLGHWTEVHEIACPPEWWAAQMAITPEGVAP